MFVVKFYVCGWFTFVGVTALFLSQFSSDLSKLYTRYHNHIGCHFYGTLRFFLTQDHMQLEFSKCYFSHNFHWSPSKLYDNIAYHSKSKCLLEYCNQKWASSTTYDNYLFQTFQKHSCVLGLQFKQIVKFHGPLIFIEKDFKLWTS